MKSTPMWGDKPYRSLNFHLKELFHEKVYKLSLDGGMTCPNRDGTVGSGGCIFCSEGGSGDFAASRTLSVTDQITSSIARMNGRGNKYIAYFQAYTNTYAPIEYLRKIYYEAIEHPDIVVVSIATRPDCLSDEVLDLLAELNQIKPVWIELGLQTMHEASARFIKRGYPLACFTEAVNRLHERGIEMIVHIILGLPQETKAQILETIAYLNTLPIQGIKLQLLHILKNTELANHIDSFETYSLEEYIDVLLSCIEHLREDIVIHRITGDGPKELLLAPMWSTNKKLVLNSIHKAMKEQHSWQGKFYKEV